MLNPTRVLAGVAFSACASLVCLSAGAADYPKHPVRLLVPFPPGGIFDAIARPWAERMKESLGTIVVENQGGAGGTRGTAAVARAQPDGYTILLGGAGPLVFAPIAMVRPPYDPIKDFEPISILVRGALAIVVHPSLPAHSLKELVQYGKANPGKLSYGSAGVGSGNHLPGELFKSLTGSGDITHIPYRGAGPAIADLVSGQIPMATPGVTRQLIDLHRAGKVRILAVTSAKRMAAAPDLPTAEEAGVEGMIAENFVGLFAPKGTAEAIIRQIHDSSRKVIQVAEFQKTLVALGFDPVPDSHPTAARQFVELEIKRWTPIIRALGLKLD